MRCCCACCRTREAANVCRAGTKSHKEQEGRPLTHSGPGYSNAPVCLLSHGHSAPHGSTVVAHHTVAHLRILASGRFKLQGWESPPLPHLDPPPKLWPVSGITWLDESGSLGPAPEGRSGPRRAAYPGSALILYSIWHSTCLVIWSHGKTQHSVG